ncbi:aldehyde dehydrogenase [Brumimicrobium aurantiacum]|uniref:Aldehyde dehydrogenase n=1 Tax=Brumimicrobium aurantiacum TaxID=1737063 RepID=A0A3E1EXS4_9FLAO|nr:aldehyde dehydrogenase [Brumimicrobium aurantiacum]RFC54360.1 aldehyde dehydrogenase [Brumimicrobium aurantiacum]
MQSQNLHQLVADQNSFFNTNSSKEIGFRIKQLKLLKSILKANEEAMNAAIYADFKKSKFDTFTNELALLYLDIDEAISKVRKWSKRKRVRTNMINFPAKSFIYPEPLGTCLVIGAWNYPIQLSFAPVIAAIAAGNTVVLKPSEVPSATSEIIAKMINDNFDASFFHVVEGGVEVTTNLLELKWDKIFFTGSVNVGKIVYKAAAQNLTPVTLELGGKSPAFITKSCNLDVAVKRLVWGKFLNAGQTCIAPDYVMVDASIKDEFLEKLKQRIIEMDFAFKNENYVQIINDKNYQRLKEMIDEEKLYYQGDFDESNRYFPPVIMHDVTFEDDVMQEEIFGPILPVITYDNISEAISAVKKLPKPLACYVFTGQRSVKHRIIDELSFGGGAVNDAIMHIVNSNLPFGGVGNSGIGNYHGKAGFDTFSHQKSVLDKATWLDPSIKYPPYSLKKLKIIRWIMGV